MTSPTENRELALFLLIILVLAMAALTLLPPSRADAVRPTTGPDWLHWDARNQRLVIDATAPKGTLICIGNRYRCGLWEEWDTRGGNK